MSGQTFDQADTGAQPNGLVAGFTRSPGNGFTVDVSLNVANGETVAVLGPNGAGKSTLVEVIAGLQPVDSGRIQLNGVTLDDSVNKIFVPAHQRRVGVVFQDYLLFDHLTVIDNVSFGLQAKGASTRSATKSAKDLLDQLDIGQLASLKPTELSGGQRQRVALARAIAPTPEALLLDEPMAALDVNARALVRRAMADLLQAISGPKILITHDPVDAFLLADRICILEEGRIIQTGTADQIRRQPDSDYVASLMGTNLLAGENAGGMVQIDNTDLTLHTVHTGLDGPVVVTVAPNAVSLHEAQPHGSPRNTWASSVAVVENRGDVTRVVLGSPVTLEVDITSSAASALGLQPGSAVWAAVKATEIAVTQGRRRA